MDFLGEAKRSKKRIECGVYSHQFDAVFYKEDSEASEVESCVVCGARDFKFIELRKERKRRRERSKGKARQSPWQV